MSNFYETLLEILNEKGITILNFASKIQIPPTTLYDLKYYNPTIQNALKIVDYFETSLDYFEKRTDKFNYPYNHNYKITFYTNLDNALKQQGITKVKFTNDLGFSISNFARWEKGILPTYANLLDMSSYLNYSIDELLGRI